MGVVPMEDIEWRYQLVALEVEGRQKFNVYSVGADKHSGQIVYIEDPDPVEISGESVDEVMNLLHTVMLNIKKHGVLTEKSVEESLDSTTVDTEEEQDYDITDREYDEDDLVSMMDQDYDDSGNVIDLVDFMNKGN